MRRLSAPILKRNAFQNKPYDGAGTSSVPVHSRYPAVIRYYGKRLTGWPSIDARRAHPD